MSNRVLGEKESRLRMASDGLILINMSNGEVSDEAWDAYTRALSKGYRTIAGYGKDDILTVEQRENFINLSSCYFSDDGERCDQNFYLLINRDNELIATGKLRPNINGNPLAEEFSGHISYSVPKDMRGKGYGVLILSHLLDEAERLNMPEVILGIDSENKASLAVAESCGFKQDGGERAPGRWSHTPWMRFRLAIAAPIHKMGPRK